MNSPISLIGEVMLFAGNYTPRGWLRCDGSSIRKADFLQLWLTIGYSYGGFEVNFNLPDLGGRYLINYDGERPDFTAPEWGDLASPGVDAPVAYLTPIAYSNLVSNINMGTLTPGKQYLVEYRANYWVLDGEAQMEEQVSGTSEFLILTAVSGNVISAHAISATYPSDTVYYDVANLGEFEQDVFFGSLNNSTGVITRRIDHANSVDCPFDWRHVKFRRWKVNPPVWASGSYVVGDFVQHLDDLYICIQDATTEAPTSELKWLRLCSLLSTAFISRESVGFRVDFLSQEYYCDCSTDFNDGTIFERSVRNVYIGPVNRNAGISYMALGTVFLMEGPYLTSNFSTGRNFIFNTIFTGFYGNHIGDDSSRNFIGADFSGNSLKSISNNTISFEFRNNEGFGQFEGNLIGKNCASNSFGYRFLSNLINRNFRSNYIPSGFNLIDFSQATLVYQNDNKQFWRSVDETKFVVQISPLGVLTASPLLT